MPKRGKVMRPKVGNNSEMRRLGAYEIHLYSQRGDHVRYGAVSTEIGSEHKGFLRWCIGAKGLLDRWYCGEGS